MTDFIKADVPVKESLKKMEKRILDELRKMNPETEYDPDDFVYSMECFYRSTGIPYVIVIDEWDAVFRIRKEDKEGQMFYLNFLRDWLKDKEYIALAYMTGILPIKKYGEHSALNMFDEYSMIAPMQLAPYTGFTDEEVRDLCQQYDRSYEDIRDWYDGYIVNNAVPVNPGRQSQRNSGVETKGKQYYPYSPLSVVSAMRYGVIRNYWNGTESYEAVCPNLYKVGTSLFNVSPLADMKYQLLGLV